MAHEELATDHAPATSARRHGKPVRYYHHGRSPAAWTGVTLAGIGFVIGTVASVTGPNMLLVWIAIGFVVASLVVSGVMKAAGYGNG